MWVIVPFLKLILTLNYINFNCKNYLEINGCAMGAKCASTYVKISMRRKIHVPRKM